MNRDSDNFTAEMVLKHLGTLDGGVGHDAPRGGRVVLAEMRAAGIPVDGVRIVDGSGLSSLDRLTAAALAGVIRAGIGIPGSGAPSSRRSPSRAAAGTLERPAAEPRGRRARQDGHDEPRLHALRARCGDVVFAVLQNGTPVSFWSARSAQDRFVTALARIAQQRTAATP